MEFSPASIDGEQCTQIIIRDRSDAKELERKLLHQSRTDSLTSLYNRQHLTTLLAQEAKKAKNGNHKATLLQIRLDDLGTIQKTCGIIGADQFLVAISKVLREVADPKDLLFRFTGPTFMLLSHESDTEKAKHYAQRIISRVEKYICTLSGHTTSSSCCIGICQIDDSTKTATDILSRSDRALNTAIDNKDDDSSLSLYQPNTAEQSQKQVDHTWAQNITKALRNNGFRLLYQPIVALEGDHTERYEVDIRLLDENNKELAQTEFLNAAQRTGLSRGINRWTINKAIEQLHKKHKSGNNTVFFIKLTKNALQDPDLFRHIHQQIKTVRIAPDSLVFEIEEETAHSQLKQARAFAKALLQINCRVAISNFGRSAKPFQLFKHVPAQYLKIDDDLMEELSSNSESQAVVQAIMAEAKLKKIATIAPGIENANSLSVLWSMSADYIQGGFLRHASENLDYDFSAMSA
ncbi:MAG: GGDEF domain-containing protein [Gammaproteobacteria bacterium]|nr:GGDEF domain-containing protein [Gammaproteobacteria bacterium]